jgi:hypothetical protein
MYEGKMSRIGQKYPRVTLGFVSCERLHYLRATLESARACINYPDLEWIVVDDDSEEPGLKEYVQGCDWIQHKIFERQTHADAMNQLVAMASGKYILIWPEDVQFITRGNWLQELVSILEDNPDIGGVCLDAQRQCTLSNILHPPFRERISRWWADCQRFGPWRVRRIRRIQTKNGFVVWTYGSLGDGIVGSGIPSLMRIDLWRQLGSWRAAKPNARIIDSSLGAEDDMIARVRQSGMRLQLALLQIPVAADIINDDIGCKAKVRKGVRYGQYTPPADGGKLYYQIHAEADLQKRSHANRPMNFSECVNPIGFSIPVDENGDRLKASFCNEPQTIVRRRTG